MTDLANHLLDLATAMNKVAAAQLPLPDPRQEMLTTISVQEWLDTQSKIKRLTAALDEVIDWLEDRSDVVDGNNDDGRPEPNAEMQLLTSIKITMGQLP